MRPGVAETLWNAATIEEMGGMFIFFVLGSGRSARLVTQAVGPCCQDHTEDSLLQLLMRIRGRTQD